MSVTGPLHDEHQHLLPRVEGLRGAAEAADADLGAALDDALEFLWEHLVPHAGRGRRLVPRRGTRHEGTGGHGHDDP